MRWARHVEGAVWVEFWRCETTRLKPSRKKGVQQLGDWAQSTQGIACQLTDSGPHLEGTGEPLEDLSRKMASAP